MACARTSKKLLEIMQSMRNSYRMNRLDLDYLGTFLTVIDCGSFTAAAERLALSQPA
ncbi:MAG: LysR family transcriptional regulator, partial [Tistrella sp.]|nr:LysR family transcriptional regulator [Tistrella sp.]